MSLGFVSRSRLTSTFSPSSDEKTIPCSDSIDQITFKGLTIPIYISLTFLDTYPLLECTFLSCCTLWIDEFPPLSKSQKSIGSACTPLRVDHFKAHTLTPYHFPSRFSVSSMNRFFQTNEWERVLIKLTHSLTVKTLRKEDFVCFLWNFIKYYISLQISHGGSDSVSWKSVHKAVQMIRLQT